MARQYDPNQCYWFPGSQQNGMDIQSYQTPRPPQPSAIEEVKSYIVNMDVSHNTDMVRMNQQTCQNAYSIGQLVQDMRILEQKVRDLSEIDRETSNESVESKTVQFPGYADDCNIRLENELYQTCSKEEIAQAYCDEADRAERCARRLRAQAEEELGHELEQTAIKAEALPAPGKKSDEPAAAVCPQSKAQSLAIENETPSKADAVLLIRDTWIPHAVEQMSPFEGSIPPNHDQVFLLEFLHYTFKGDEWSDGLYFIAEDSILPSQTYWILDADHEPYLPPAPGQHGAKLTALMHEVYNEPGPDPENYNSVPVFIRAGGSEGYRYYGNYSQTRFSDKVDYDRLMSTIPDHVLHYWADQLASNNRPEWITKKLIEQFWPKPTYEGRISSLHLPATVASSSSKRVVSRVQKDLEAYCDELTAWTKDTHIRVSLLTADEIYNSFKNADLDCEPGLRLWWEYFECVAYDSNFYTMLVNMKNNPRLNPPNTGKPGAKRPPTPVNDDDGSTALKRGEIDEKGRPVVRQQPQLESLGTFPTRNPHKAAAKKVDDPGATLQKEFEALRQGEIAAQPTRFTKPPFDEFIKKVKKNDEEIIKPAIASSKSSKPNTKSHTGGTKPWEKEQEKNAGAPVSWDGFGDIQAAKDFKNEVIDKRNGDGEDRGNRGRGRGRGVPPHLRGK